MQCAENEMTGKTRGHSDICSLKVANLANHDDIGRLPQDGAQRGREGHSDFRIHLHLVDSSHLIFNRLFDGDDFAVGFVNVIEAGVKGGRLAGTGWASHEQNPIGKLDQTFERFPVVAEKAKLRQPHDQA